MGVVRQIFVPPTEAERSFSSASGKLGPRWAAGDLLRGYVVAVYNPDDLDAENGPRSVGITDDYPCILCDVVIIENEKRGLLTRVPIMTQAHGLTDYAQWIPRAATVNLLGNDLKLQRTPGSSVQDATPLHETDGDIVVIGFVGNDYNRPIILGALAHPNSLVKPSVDDNPQYKLKRHVRGNVIGVRDTGEIDIDLSAQTSGAVEGDGSLTASANPTMVITAPDAVVTIDGSKVEIDYGSGDAKVTIDGAKVEIDVGGGTSKATIENSQVVIEQAGGAALTLDSGGVDIDLAFGQQTTIAGATSGLGTTQQPVLLENALTDIAAVLTEFAPYIAPLATAQGAAAAAKFALITPVIAGLAAGLDPITGNSYKSLSTETD